MKSERTKENPSPKDTSENPEPLSSKISVSENATTPKTEITDEPPSSPSPNYATNNTETKATEPLTTAAAPIQKTSPDKSLSPVEVKENVPATNAASDPVEAKNSAETEDVIEVPYKPKTPEIIDLESDTYKTITSSNNNTNHLLNNNVLHEVKRRKLDILKEGGLEVTPVTNVLNSEQRPTVIQQNVPPTVHMGNIPVPAADKKFMPPPSINATLIKKPTVGSSQISPVPSTKLAQNLCTKPKPPTANSNNNTMFTYMNGVSPPKVMQSKSIYSPSQKTVYGNPKDCFIPTIHAVQTPKFVNTKQSNGGDILDLTVKSPQKPGGEVMQVPSNMQSVNWNTAKESSKKPQIPLFDGRRVGSNLEITLVNPPNDKSYLLNSNHMVNSNINSRHMAANQTNSYYNKLPKKRALSESYTPVKIPRVGENVSPRQINPSNYGQSQPRDKHVTGHEINIPSPYGISNRNSHERVHEKAESRMNNNNSNLNNNKHSNHSLQNMKPYTTVPPVYPNYMSQLSGSVNKGLNPYTLPVPLYYTALQNLYPTHLNSVPPFLQLPTPEQLQFYNDLITHNSRVRLPFQFPQDGSSSISSSNLNNVKKQ